MNEKTFAVRAMLKSMAPCRSIPVIQSFLLPQEEEMVLIEHEANGKSLTQIAMENNLSIETVKRRRKNAFIRISNSI